MCRAKPKPLIEMGTSILDLMESNIVIWLHVSDDKWPKPREQISWTLTTLNNSFSSIKPIFYSGYLMKYYFWSKLNDTDQCTDETLWMQQLQQHLAPWFHYFQPMFFHFLLNGATSSVSEVIVNLDFEKIFPTDMRSPHWGRSQPELGYSYPEVPLSWKIQQDPRVDGRLPWSALCHLLL